MARTMTDKAREFLELKRFALVGVSHSEKHFSRVVLRELLNRGYDVIPVSPVLTEAEGRACLSRVQDIAPPVYGALLMTPSSRTEQVVRDCIESNIRKVWMHRGTGAGAGSPAALALCEKNDIDVITDLCPFMVLPDVAWPHRAHGFFRRLAPGVRKRHTASA